MNLYSRITELQRKHMSLAQAVEIAQKSPALDHLWVAELKKKKLLLKEEISRLSKYNQSLNPQTRKRLPRKAAVG
jgi:hypothetical protein